MGDRQNRDRDRDNDDLLARIDPPPDRIPKSFVGQVVTKKPGPQLYVLVNPVDVAGLEIEGSGPSFTTDGSRTISVAIIRGNPAVGDYIICMPEKDRWVAERTLSTGGGGGTGDPIVPIPFCFCTQVPATLNMVSFNPTANFEMFQSCTIAYQPVPPIYAPLGLGAMAFISNESFPDPTGDGALFQYLLICIYNQWSLTRIYPSSIYSPSGDGPWMDAIIYVWYSLFVGSSGGALGARSSYCGPDLLSLGAGLPYPGSDPTACVIIYGGSGVAAPACIS